MAVTPAAQRVRQALENDIVEGKLTPGERVDPEALARQYGCSRTPVREACRHSRPPACCGSNPSGAPSSPS